MDFMLDTNILNRIIDGRLTNEWSLRGRTFVTDIQLQEVLDTSSDARRGYLLRGLLALQLNVIRPSEMPQLFDQARISTRASGSCSAWRRSGTAALSPLSFGNYVPAIADDLPPQQAPTGEPAARRLHRGGRAAQRHGASHCRSAPGGGGAIVRRRGSRKFPDSCLVFEPV